MGVKGTLNPLLYSHRGLEIFRITARVVNGIIVFWKQVNNIMNDGLACTQPSTQALLRGWKMDPVADGVYLILSDVIKYF